ncbi:MAG: polysaccharide deacetylase family protein [Ruminococcus bromii]|nr:polysaccharide deacetylase family protein [Ruminococcus bromii]
MRLLILTKRKLISIGFCLLTGILAATVAISSTVKAVQTANTPREIPIYHVDTDKKQVALSFDAAWGNEQTNTLLDILDQYEVKTTFFLVGAWVDNYPESVKDIADKGHDIGNHSNTHPHMTQMSSSDMTKEVEECNKKIEEITGCRPTLFRAPYGDYNNDVVKSVNGCNMYCVQWDVDSLDWKDPTPQQITQNVLKKLQDGSIILMHNGAKNTPEALPMVIEGIKEKGYEIVPISEILLKGDYYTDVNGKMCAKECETTVSENSN